MISCTFYLWHSRYLLVKLFATAILTTDDLSVSRGFVESNKFYKQHIVMI